MKRGIREQGTGSSVEEKGVVITEEIGFETEIADGEVMEGGFANPTEVFRLEIEDNWTVKIQ